MTIVERHPRISARVFAMVLVLLMTPLFGAAGEFKIGRYIEPNQMSNLFTRHVRKGIVKRIGLSEAQLYQIRDAIDPHREKLVAQITDLKDSRIEVVEAVVSEPYKPERVRSAYAAATSADLELMLTAGAIIRDIRPILTEDQLREVAEMMEEVRESSELRFADFAKKLAAGELLGLKDKNSSRGG